MPASNECIDWSGVRTQVSGGGLKWLTSDPGTGTLPSNRVNTSGEFWSYIKTNASNPYSTNMVMNWSEMQTYRKLNYSNYALRFSSLKLIAGTAFAVPTAYTIMAWVRRNSSSSVGTIASHNSTSGGQDYGWNLEIDTSGYVYGYQGNSGTGDSGLFVGPLTVGTWYHVALSVGTGTSNMQLYLNGAGSSGGPVSVTVPSSATNLSPTVGTYQTWFQQANSGTVLTGVDLDELRYFNVGMTSTDINTQMNNDLASSTNVLDYWKFENNLTATYGSDLSVLSGTTSYVTDTGV